MKIDLDLSNKEEAKKQLEKIQFAIDELLDVCNKQKAQLKENLEVMTTSEEQIINLTKASVDMADTIKAVHRILQARKEKFEGDDAMKTVMDSLATFVVSSGAIKLGVISNAEGEK